MSTWRERARAKGVAWINENARRFAEQFAPVYEQLHWTWDRPRADAGGEPMKRVPNADELEAEIKNLANAPTTRPDGKPEPGHGGFFVMRTGGLSVGVVPSDGDDDAVDPDEPRDFEAFVLLSVEESRYFSAYEADHDVNKVPRWAR